MTIEFDDNGKFYTDIISKTPIPVMIQTTTHRIHGNIHITQDRRLKDELDLPEKFMAVTDAVVYSQDGQILHQAGFMAVLRDGIVWIIPDSEIKDSPERNGK
ncbi:MAG: hypothetical protein ABSA01_06625 [Anaerolineales bacterium]|jgi:hypothetical protein